MAGLQHPVTPDGRYFVVRGRLWRMAGFHQKGNSIDLYLRIIQKRNLRAT
jgi:hypothetical protein